MTRATIPARPTIHLGTLMRSRLEAHWARRLDLAGMEPEYEPVVFSDDTGQYLPDFRFTEKRPGDRTRTVYVEIKGVVDDPRHYCRRMEVIWSSEPDATLLLVEGHGSRYWLGWKDPDRGAVWCCHGGFRPDDADD